MATINQNPEQLARDRIDEQLTDCGWIIQNNSSINFHAAIGITVREYSADVGPADYVLFIDKKPAGIIEAKRAEEGVHFTIHREQSHTLVLPALKCLNNDRLPFVYIKGQERSQFFLFIYQNHQTINAKSAFASAGNRTIKRSVVL